MVRIAPRLLLLSIRRLLLVVLWLVVGCSDASIDVSPKDADAVPDGGGTEEASVPAPTIPGPTNVTALAGDRLARLSWQSTAVDVIEFVVTSIPGGVAAKTASTSVLLTGLTNGTKYRFVVTATTAAGVSAPSAASNEVIPAGLPGAPTKVTATGGNAAAAVSWAPSTDNGSPITTYTVTRHPGGTIMTAAGTSSSVEVIGLGNGTSYTFTVTATNGIGTSAASAASNAVTPLPPPNAPDAPANLVGVPGNGTVSISWTAPNDKGLAITGYTVTSSPEGRQATTTNTSAAVNGLTNGVSYTFTVTATNAAGTSLPSVPSAAVMPTGPPSAPTGVTAIRGNASASVSWTAPNDGGRPITGYTVTSNPDGVTATTATTNVVVSGLTNGTSYRFTVTATNDVGTGPASTSSNAVTPASAPDAPTAVTAAAGNGAAVISWTAPANNGAAVTSYTITSSPGSFTATVPTTSGTVGGLTNGVSYTFTVKATNAVGQGPASSVSNSIAPAICAQTTYVVTNPGAGYVFSGVTGTNPVVTICRGQTYTFRLQNVVGHPFEVLNGAFAAHPNVTNNGADGSADIVWTVSASEPVGAHYVCLLHAFMTNSFDLH